MHITKYCNNWLLHLTLLSAILCTSVVLAMEKKSVKSKSIKKQAPTTEQLQYQREKQYQEGKYFIFEEGTSNGILVDKKLVNSTCEFIKSMVEDLGGDKNLFEIPLNFPIKIIKLAFGVLEKKINVNKLSLDQLKNVADVFNYVAVTSEIFPTILKKIKKQTDKEIKKKTHPKEIKTLHPDLQKSLMIDETTACLKKLVTKKYPREQQIFGESTENINSVDYSPNGKNILVGYNGTKDNIMIFDISDPNNITEQPLKSGLGHLRSVICAKYSPDGHYIVSCALGNTNNLTLWDISNPDSITRRSLIGHPSSVLCAAWSHNSKRIVSGCFSSQFNLILWDISDKEKISIQFIMGSPIAGHTNSVNAVDMSADDKYIISGSSDAQNNLILWNISDLNHITSQALIGHTTTVYAVAFSPNGAYIVSGGFGNKDNLIIWNAKTGEKIKVLTEHANNVRSVVISHDSTKIASGDEDGNIIIWNASNLENIIIEQKFLTDTTTAMAMKLGFGGTQNIAQDITGHTDAVLSLTFSPNNTHLVSGGIGEGNNLFLWTIMSEQNTLIKALKDYNSDQIRLLYQLCLQSSSEKLTPLKEGSEEHTIFITLPKKMQELLHKLFFSEPAKTKKSGWFGK